MSPSVFAFHAHRLGKMLRDLQLEPGSMIVAGGDFALVDDLSRRKLTPGLNNQTLAEGLVSAVKIAAAATEAAS